MSHVLVDSNVILDVVTDDPLWGNWSGTMLSQCADGGLLVINPIIYAEVSVGFKRIEELDEVRPDRASWRRPRSSTSRTSPSATNIWTSEAWESRTGCR
ncbi:MAG TPA: hypothetical protein VGM86_18790 [Thermoanaerobaculia bacterium]